MQVLRPLRNGSFIESVESLQLDLELLPFTSTPTAPEVQAYHLNQTLFEGRGTDERRRAQARLRKAEIVV